ncbi:MAG: AAA family ATPase [Bacteroidota bacterium]
MHTPALILLRGLPGSGKSSVADLLSENGRYPVLSVDDYFTDEQRNYSFRFDENHLAYKHCEERTQNYMLNKQEKIFLDNAFTLEWEMEPYFRMAAENSYFIFVLTVENRGHNKNIHGITDDQLQKMAEKYKVVLL